MDLSHLRQEYTQTGLSRAQLLSNPIQQFEYWFQQAQQGGVFEPNAMQIATVDAKGRPSLRTVLLKSFDERGLVFFTNYASQKAHDIALNPQVSLLFVWKELERQVEINGTATKVGALETLQYFTSRPRGSQLGAWVSEQSAIVESKQFLLDKLAQYKQQFASGEVPVPRSWGGYRIEPHTIEFWQGRPNRLHDRFEYRKQVDQSWEIVRLSP